MNPKTPTAEVIDILAREEIHRIKDEQYAQHALIDSAKNLAQTAAELTKITSERQTSFIVEFERRMGGCDAQHEAAGYHRRKSDQEMSVIAKTLQETLEINRQNQTTNARILEILEEHSTTVKRVQKSHTTVDTLKIWLGYLAIAYVAWSQLKDLVQ